MEHAQLLQVVFEWQNTSEGSFDLPGLSVESVTAPHVTSQFDLTLLLREAGEQVVGGLEFAKALFDRETLTRYLEHWRTLLKAMVAEEVEAVNRLALLGETERRQLLIDWNAT